MDGEQSTRGTVAAFKERQFRVFYRKVQKLLTTEHTAKMRPLLRSFIVSSMNSRNRQHVWTWLFCPLLFWLHLLKKGRRTPAPRAEGTSNRPNWLKFTLFPCTVPTQPKIGMLYAMKTM